HALKCTSTNGLAMVARALTGFAYHATFDEAFQPLHVSGSRSVSSAESCRDSHDPWSRTGALRVMNMASDLEIHDAASSSALSCGYDRHFRTLAESLPQIVWLASADCCVGYQNRRWCEYTGLASADSMGSGWKQAVHPDDLPEILRRWERAVRGGEPCELAFRLRRSDAVYRWFQGRAEPLLDNDNRTVGWFAVCGESVDISQRKGAEKALRKQNERLRLLWETAGILFSTDNPDAMIQGLFEKISDHLRIDTCLQYMANEQGDALCLQFCSGVPADAIPSLSRLTFGQAICGGVAQSRHPFMATFIQQTDDARAQLVKAFGLRTYACNPLVANGQVLGTLSFGSRSRGLFNDDELEFMEIITNYVTVAYERMRLLSQLHDRDRRKDEFLAMLAHELRNPLAPIRNAVQFLSLK